MDGNQQTVYATDETTSAAVLAAATAGETRNDWSLEEVAALFRAPFADLLYTAQTVHRRHFNPNQVQISTLLSVKTGGCPEDCGYCPQSIRFETDVANEAILELDEVIANARAAKDNGATRFCMGAAWRSPKPKQMEKIVAGIKSSKASTNQNLNGKANGQSNLGHKEHVA